MPLVDSHGVGEIISFVVAAEVSEWYDKSSTRVDVVVGVSSEVWSENSFGVEKAPDPGVASHVNFKIGLSTEKCVCSFKDRIDLSW